MNERRSALLLTALWSTACGIQMVFAFSTNCGGRSGVHWFLSGLSFGVALMNVVRALLAPR